MEKLYVFFFVAAMLILVKCLNVTAGNTHHHDQNAMMVCFSLSSQLIMKLSLSLGHANVFKLAFRVS
jgi:hypothetical protein